MSGGPVCTIPVSDNELCLTIRSPVVDPDHFGTDQDLTSHFETALDLHTTV